ncbi:MAG TPA: thioredoxin domain-containing protein, partial [Flavobacterium sp.]
MNELHLETSPYLLQHANNPVHWKAWNNKTLATAKEQNKLIIISVGYSACHWCHVMEHDSFEDEQAAHVMNENFICIKVDREERPDVDAVYMKAVQLMGGHGGWPLNIVALPDGRPVWGGTYFPKAQWIDYLQQLSLMYKVDAEKLLDYAQRLHYGIESISMVQPSEANVELSQDLIKPLISKWRKSFDHEYGGMARAPKFMMPNNYRFLMRYAFQNNDKKLLNFVNLTLTKMAYGGLFDTVDGGFSRYSVDMKWHVPHFEKMLYDNGQLVSLYSDAYKLTKNPIYKEVIGKTLEFVERELTTQEGAFYSALDADSLDANGHLEEGAFYVWTEQQLKELVGDDFELLSEVFNINEFGYWENGNYVLIQNRPLEEIASENKMSISDLQSKKQQWERLLFSEREKRSKPRLDDKCLTSWNAIMLKGYIDAYKALQTEDYLIAATNNANFILNKVWSPDGNLFHSYKDGKCTINGYLEDYAWVISAFISMYEITLNEEWLSRARQLTDYCFDNFLDEGQTLFRFTSKRDEALIATHYETEDNVIPASNSVMAENLFKLSNYFENPTYGQHVDSVLKQILPGVDYPSAFSNWLHLLLNFSGNKELAICGSNARDNVKRFNSQYLPNVLVAGSEKPTSLPFLKDRYNS